MMLDELLDEIHKEFPDFVMIKKPDSRFMRAIAWLLCVLTFGTQREFMTRYTTTIGHTVYIPGDWGSWDELSCVEVLRHERVHMRQQSRYGRLLFTFLYLLPFLPLFLAYGRARLEMEAYTESVRARAQLRGAACVQVQGFRDWLASQFLTGSYGFMWPFRKTVLRWVEEAIKKAVAEFPEEEKK